MGRAHALLRRLPLDGSSTPLPDALESLLAELASQRSVGARLDRGAAVAQALEATRSALGLGPWEEVLR
ncbi:MAG: hypothetical protein H5U40_08440 [Polyangiaceae bacterium]|nr:hypothetical protein [Polyangiaceae bacterium]